MGGQAHGPETNGIHTPSNDDTAGTTAGQKHADGLELKEPRDNRQDEGQNAQDMLLAHDYGSLLTQVARNSITRSPAEDARSRFEVMASAGGRQVGRDKVRVWLLVVNDRVGSVGRMLCAACWCRHKPDLPNKKYHLARQQLHPRLTVLSQSGYHGPVARST